MNNRTKRIMLFLFGCTVVRFALARAVLKERFKNAMMIALSVISIGFMYIYLTDSRKVGPETMGEPIWWNYLRPIHSILYGSAALALIKDRRELSSNILMVDLTIGLLSFILHHFS